MTFDQRRNERCELSCSLEYVLDPFKKEEIYEGTVIDISKTGMCFSTSYPLKTGQEIFILTEVSILPTQDAVVTRSEEDGDQFRVAVEFIMP
jgi:c-di-GMP-binding flagellar brake protein YcgR